MGSRQRAFLLGTASYLAVAVLTPRLSFAEVSTDGSLGRRVSLRGGDITVGAELGQQRGGNLFHSFRKFDVETKGRVAFTGPDSVKNVIGRVTGGEPSSIDGTLASTIPDADLYLINPAGILFGPNARLDVKGSFHASTADELRLTDGAVFSALDTAGSTLTVAEPLAFGFLGAAPGSITLNGGLLVGRVGETVSLTAGEVALAGGAITAEAGRVGLVALTGTGAVEVAAGEPIGGEAGRIGLGGGVVIETSGAGGGSIALRGREMRLGEGAVIRADNRGDAAATGGVTIAAADLVMDGAALVSASAFGAGSAGTVRVEAGKMTLAGGAGIDSSGNGGGAIIVHAAELALTGGSFVRADNRGDTNAGRGVTIAADVLRIGGAGSRIAADAIAGSGRAGQLDVQASQVEIVDLGQLSSTTRSRGDAGVIRVATGRLLVDGKPTPPATVSNTRFTGITVSPDANSSGNAGRMYVHADDLVLRDGGRFLSITPASGNAGIIEVAAGRILLEHGGSDMPTGITSRANSRSTGRAGNVIVTAEDLEVREEAFITSSTLGAGLGGTVQVSADRIRVASGGSIASRAGKASGSIRSTGYAGNVTVSARTLDISGGNVTSEAEEGAGGRAGNVTVSATESVRIAGVNDMGGELSSRTATPKDAGSVRLTSPSIEIVGGGVITSSTTGDGGNAGSVQISANTLVLDRGVFDRPTGITARANSRSTGGSAGDVIVTAEDVVVRNGTYISSSTFGRGDAGTVQISADRLTVASAGIVASQAGIRERRAARGDAGSVLIRVGSLDLVGGTISTAAAEGASGNAGNITVEASGRVRIAGGGLQSTTNGGGDAGTIRVDSRTVEVGQDGRISSNAGQGTAGRAGAVTVNAQEVAVAGREAHISASTGGSGMAGQVEVNGARLMLADAGSINSSTTGDGAAGDVTVRMSEALSLAGGEIATNSASAGTAGNVAVSAPSVMLAGGAISSSALGNGAAGTVQLATAPGALSGLAAMRTAGLTGMIELSDGADVTTSTKGLGAAGRVTVSSGTLSLRGVGTKISSNTTGAGAAGDVRVEASQSVSLDQARIESSSTGTGAGGNVRIVAPTAIVTLKGEGTIAASAEAGGGAGNVVIGARKLDAKDGVISTSGGGAKGGRVTVSVRERIYLRDTQVTSSGALPKKGASVIKVTAPEIVLSRSQIESLTGANSAIGSGEAQLDGDLTVISSESQVVASSDVIISGLQTNLGSDLQLPSTVFLNASGLLQASCVERGAARSTFTRGGRGGLPPSPDRPLPSAGAREPAGGTERSAAAGPIFFDACEGTLVREANS